MNASVIRFRLDLLVRLIDTTTGESVEERNVRFFRDAETVHPIPRGSGNYVFLNCGRTDSSLEVCVYGYEPFRMRVRYETLDEKMPVIEAFLIPSENAQGSSPVLGFTGNLPGIQSIQAVNVNKVCCCIGGFDERKRIMKLFGIHRLGMDGIHYGLIHPDRQDFEPFAVQKEISGDAVKIDHPLKEPFSVNAPISRIIFGSVTQEGDYCIRVRDDREQLLHLIRYVVEDEVKFRMVDFRHPESALL
ncbi:MAG: hypothetical protein HFH85_04190 [Lachnospiraceae bacterium]|jgi:hypothetical protein|nr:hypothetical protein [Lachnospiraceae bacterium]